MLCSPASAAVGNNVRPRLHFDVIPCCTKTIAGVDRSQTLPVSFRNASPIVVQRDDADRSCGLKNGVFYTAEPYSL
jgi:hypothetical protein